MKACDSVDWKFLLQCLSSLGVSMRFVSWIRECKTTPRFSIALNGTRVGYFEGRKGLRQGDLISPYLFVIAMEMLSRLIEEASKNGKEYSFHPRCSEINLTHLCFADATAILDGKYRISRKN